MGSASVDVTCSFENWWTYIHNTPTEKLIHSKGVSYQKIMHRKIIAWKTCKLLFRIYFFQLIICFHFEHQSNTCNNKLFKLQIVCMKIAIQNVWLKLIAIIACFYNIYTWCHCIFSGHFLNNRKLNKYISFLHWNKIKQKPTNGEEKKPYQWF